ncbi:hypothetical protein [Thiorhodococcus minor]|uniref:DUF104 domain-containing protein n=1 Tax=Thiorhodococcus minor TaxID=57489 RepID=A0A6M0K090_9GAMM|nr:hypothetical protein [Thiorhodococcus minor]NEV62353.1 hypothetical protein [Thiorhodococcus minor]
MLTTVEGIYENGQIHLLESLPGVARARVVITVLPETMSPLPSQDGSPLDWSLSEEERQIWEDLPDFREMHPITLDALDDKP